MPALAASHQASGRGGRHGVYAAVGAGLRHRTSAAVARQGTAWRAAVDVADGTGILDWRSQEPLISHALQPCSPATWRSRLEYS